MPLRTSQRSYRFALAACRVVSFFLLCLSGLLFGGVCALFTLLLFEQSEISTVWPPSPFEVVFLGLGSLIGVSLGIWAGVRSEMEWRKDERQL